MIKLFHVVLRSSICLALVSALPTSAQDADEFELFEQVEASTSNRSASDLGRRSRQAPSDQSSTEAVFTLIGTSKIGSTIYVNLRHMSGEKVRVQYRGVAAQIPGYQGFFVSDVRGRSVSIGQPDDVPCVAYEDKGIECDYERNISRLRLTTEASVLHNLEINSPNAEESSIGEPQANPFDILRRAASSDNAPEPPEGNARRFQPRRIDPADVPPGMRIVSTPFGDRLVEI